MKPASQAIAPYTKVGILSSSAHLFPSTPVVIEPLGTTPVQLHPFPNYESLVHALKTNHIQQMLLLCRDPLNHVNQLFTQLVTGRDATTIVEVGALQHVVHVYEVRPRLCSTSETVMIAAEHDFLYPFTYDSSRRLITQNGSLSSLMQANTPCIIPFAVSDELSIPDTHHGIRKFTTTLEFRIFERNRYRSSIIDAVRLCLATLLRGMLSTTGSFIVSAVVITIGLLVTIFLSQLDASAANWVSVTTTVVVVILQIVAQSKYLDQVLLKQVLSGRWIYYSVPVDRSMNKAIPNGFVTRQFTISLKDKELFFSGRIPYHDQAFFETRKVAVDLNSTQKKLNGFYDFTTPEGLALDSRIEGLVRLYGERSSIFRPFRLLEGWYTGRATKVIGMLRYIRVSEQQYQKMSKSLGYLKNEQGNSPFAAPLTIGVYGLPYSQTHLASRRKFGSRESFVFINSIQGLLNSLRAGTTQLAVIPIENSITGPVNNHINQIKAAPVIQVGTISAPIHYCLAAQPNTPLSAIQKVTTHEQTRLQCEAFIRQSQYQFIDHYTLRNGHTYTIEDSASAAKYLGDQPDSSIAVICSLEAASDYGLDVLIANIPVDDNVTTFGLYIRSLGD